MPTKSQCTRKKAVGRLCQRNLHLLAFWTVLQASVEWHLFMSYSTCLARCAALYQLSCASELPVWGPSSRQDCQAAEERLCGGNVLQRYLLGKAARLVLGQALSGSLGTCPFPELWSIRYLRQPFLFQNMAKCFVAVFPFPSVAYDPALVPGAEVSGCSLWDSTAHPGPQLGCSGLKTEPKCFLKPLHCPGLFLFVI